MWWLDKGCTAQGLEGKVGSALCLGPPQKEAFTWDTVAAGGWGKGWDGSTEQRFPSPGAGYL